MAIAVCPVCQRQFEREASPAMPFCSERCRQIDLGRWLSEAYVLPGEEPTAEHAVDRPEDGPSQDLPDGNEDA